MTFILKYYNLYMWTISNNYGKYYKLGTKNDMVGNLTLETPSRFTLTNNNCNLVFTSYEYFLFTLS